MQKNNSCNAKYQHVIAIISAFLYRYNVLIIPLTSHLTFPYNTFLQYFGMKTIEYMINFYCPFRPPAMLKIWLAIPIPL